jgi:hypothetical protein
MSTSILLELARCGAAILCCLGVPHTSQAGADGSWLTKVQAEHVHLSMVQVAQAGNDGKTYCSRGELQIISPRRPKLYTIVFQKYF